MNKLVISFSLLVFIGCGGGDWSENLGNDYIYISESSKQEWIMFEGAKFLEEANQNYIPCDIIDYRYNSQYIIAKIKFHYQNECVVGFKESKELKEGKIYYYIIDKENNLRYGAYSDKNSFKKQIQKLRIELELS